MDIELFIIELLLVLIFGILLGLIASRPRH